MNQSGTNIFEEYEIKEGPLNGDEEIDYLVEVQALLTKLAEKI